MGRSESRITLRPAGDEGRVAGRLTPRSDPRAILVPSGNLSPADRADNGEETHAHLDDLQDGSRCTEFWNIPPSSTTEPPTNDYIEFNLVLRTIAVRLECDSCGHRHRMGERVFDEDAKRMICPNCGHYPFTVDRGDISWHPRFDE